MTSSTTTPPPKAAAPQSGSTKGRSPRSPQERSNERFAWSLVLPAVVVVALFFLFPVGYAGWLSLTDAQQLRPDATSFVGVENYGTLLTDPQFLAALGRTAYFTAITVVVGVGIALGLAILLTQEFRGRTVARVLLLVPWAVPPVVNGIMWKYIFDPSWGVANAILRGLGIIDENIAWLGTGELALNAIILAEVWKLLPFVTLILIAAMQSIPKSRYKAAAIDGAHAWSRFRHITLPGIRYALLFGLITQTMWSIKVFDSIYVLTQGGPARGTTTLNYFGYLQTFSYLDVGYGAAAAFLVMLLVFGLTMLYVRVLRRTEKVEA